MNKNKLIKIVALSATAVLLAFSGILVSCLMNKKDKGTPDAKPQELEYALSADKTYYIVAGVGESKDPVLVIPTEYKEIPVKEIKERAFEGCDFLTSVKVGENVTKIGNYAFKDCNKVAEVSLGDSLTQIGDYAFQATALTEVVIPSSVTAIGGGVFYECLGLKNIVVEQSNASYKSIGGNLYTKDGTELLQYAVGKTETSFITPTTVTRIGLYAFSYCNLEKITLSENVKNIVFYAFSDCAKLDSVTFGKGIKNISKYVFENCKALANITYQGTVAEWEKVDKSDGWAEGVIAQSVVCEDGNGSI